jgi:hypothetical protein
MENMNSKLIIAQIVCVLAPLIFYVFTDFVERKLPEIARGGWRIFRIGGFIALAGAWIAVYLLEIEVAAVLTMAEV